MVRNGIGLGKSWIDFSRCHSRTTILFGWLEGQLHTVRTTKDGSAANSPVIGGEFRQGRNMTWRIGWSCIINPSPAYNNSSRALCFVFHHTKLKRSRIKCVFDSSQPDGQNGKRKAPRRQTNRTLLFLRDSVRTRRGIPRKSTQLGSSIGRTGCTLAGSFRYNNKCACQKFSCRKFSVPLTR